VTLDFDCLLTWAVRKRWSYLFLTLDDGIICKKNSKLETCEKYLYFLAIFVGKLTAALGHIRHSSSIRRYVSWLELNGDYFVSRTYGQRVHLTSATATVSLTIWKEEIWICSDIIANTFYGVSRSEFKGWVLSSWIVRSNVPFSKSFETRPEILINAEHKVKFLVFYCLRVSDTSTLTHNNT
jgi:hypothetical protein